MVRAKGSRSSLVGAWQTTDRRQFSECRRPTDRADERIFRAGRPFGGTDDGNNASTPRRARTMGCCFSVEDHEVSHPASHARDKYNRETDEASQTLMVRPPVPPRWSLHFP